MHHPERIDQLVGQWAAQRPDLDLKAMALAVRLLTVGQLIDARINGLAAEYGLHRSEGDVLFTLRRAGAPFRLTPTQLAESLMVTTGTMTNRLDRLQGRGLITRVPNPDDRRGVIVELTPAGLELVEAAVTRHVANESDMLSVLDDHDRAELTRITDALITHLSESSRAPS
ncbi:MarR family winged helix-turn-helix transcriptional regulator [Nocardia pneumoniae]|uniref:MarR family winged helix-turn-helix transcriptional regulator n=1 Tax=Nocardia pneumoniae TaxID=228601 RepID=UPI0002DD713A|nr:MarR family transcriptional regulator [Nocardia pneumoniae]